jgi:hypothetical protein
MPENEDTEGGVKPVSMDDLKSMETSLRSAMESQMESMMKMISDRLPSAPSVIPVIEERDKSGLEKGDASDSPSSSTPLGSDHLDNNKIPITSPKATSVDASYHVVAPSFRSPDIPVPHPHINTRGDPPKFNDQDFATWKFEFRSHV